jgi:thiol-disulfide isomerase/thioredoxin
MVNYRKTIFLAIILVFLFGCNSRDKNIESTTTGKIENIFTSSEFKWENAPGTKFDFRSYKGKLVLINFWATWCSPCKAELPDLVALSKEFEPLGLKVLGISIDRGGNVDTLVGKFVKEHNINYDVIIDDGSLQKAFGNIRGVPTTFIVSKDGKIAESFVGARPKNFFVTKINQYIQ